MSKTKLSCIFCAIISDAIPAKKILERDDLVVIKDIAPKAPIHYLIIPKLHLPNLLSCTADQTSIAGNIFFTAHELAKQLSDSQSFRLIMNNGADVGQTVFHWHVHFLAGKQMADF